MAKYWGGDPPTRCNACHKEIKNEFYDAKTKMGPWFIMCKECFKIKGIGVGTGLGQYYEIDLLKEGRTFVKKEG